MKRSIQYGILIAEAFACIGLVAMSSVAWGAFSGMLAFPFEQIGLGLRALSLSGFWGNLAAIMLYVAICLCPGAVLLVRKERKFYPEDSCLILLSLTLFLVIYQMINPGDISLVGGFSQGLSIAKAVLGGTVYSIIMGYALLRVLRHFYTSEGDRVQSYLTALLFLLNMLFVAVIFGSGVSEVIKTIQGVQVSNSGNTHLFGINYFFIVLRFIIDSLPYALNILIVFSAMSLLQSFKLDKYSAATIASAKKLSKVCGVSLSLVVSSNIAFNVLQLLFKHKLFSVTSAIQIPLFSIAFVLTCLLLTQLITDNKALKDENDSII